MKEFIYWFWKSIVFVSWCLVDGWFWWTTISVNFLPYVFNLRLMYFLATILNNEDGWSDSIPNLCSKKWSGTLLKMCGPSCANTAHSIFRSRFFSVFIPVFFASGVPFEKYACSISTDFFIFDGDGSNVLVLDSTNFFSQEIYFLIQFFASVFETVEKLMVLHFLCSRWHWLPDVTVKQDSVKWTLQMRLFLFGYQFCLLLEPISVKDQACYVEIYEMMYFHLFSFCLCSHKLHKR